MYTYKAAHMVWPKFMRDSIVGGALPNPALPLYPYSAHIAMHIPIIIYCAIFRKF